MDIMEITDLEGRVIKITDLDGSIAMVEEYMSYFYDGDCESLKRFEERRRQYWRDIHQKLMYLKENQTGEML